MPPSADPGSPSTAGQAYRAGHRAHRGGGGLGLAWGREHGARWAVLQVALRHTDARAFHHRLGATEHHRYHYLVSG